MAINSNNEYNRERVAQNEWAKRDFDAEKMIEQVHREAIDRMQKQIDEFYLKYAKAEGLTRAEANKRLKNMNVQDWANKAAETVERALYDKKFNKAMYEHNKKMGLDYFSPETNKWLKAYNAKMRISRIELLKGELEIELQKMYAQDNAIIDYHLMQEYRAELERQAGILGNSAKGASKRLESIVNADFYGAEFSERIWGRNGYYQDIRRDLFGSLNRIYTDMDGYRKERNFLMKKYDATKSEAMRLLKTETARVRATADSKHYHEHDFTHYRYVAEPGACSICSALDGKVFPIDDMEIGVNMFPMHPNCRCSTYGIIKIERKDGTTNLDDYEVVE